MADERDELLEEIERLTYFAPENDHECGGVIAAVQELFEKARLAGVLTFPVPA